VVTSYANTASIVYVLTIIIYQNTVMNEIMVLEIHPSWVPLKPLNIN